MKQTQSKQSTMSREFWHLRLDIQEVFLPPRTHIRAQNQNLRRFGYVYLLRGVITPDLPQKIVTTLAMEIGG